MPTTVPPSATASCEVKTRRSAFDENGDVVICSRDAIYAIAGAHDHLRKAVGAEHNIAVGVGRQQRHIADIRVGEQEAELQRVRLDIGPGRHAVTVGAGQQLARGVQLAVRAGDVVAQENLMRGMRGVGLVLVDERRRRVSVFVQVIRRTDQAVGAGKVGWPASAP